MGDVSYLVPVGPHRAEHVVSRSRFITTLARAPTATSAHAFVERIRDEFPDATHHCWAFVAGSPGSTTHVGLSDAGEPKGTAGRPILTVLLHSGVGEVVAVSSRWFGGTKLGTGGLARAYAEGVSQALEALATEPKVRRERFDVFVGYAHVDALRQLMGELGAVLEREGYGADVRYRVGVPADTVRVFEDRLADITAGEGRVSRDVPPERSR